MYSQGREQDFILEYFYNRTDGRLLDIGAYHPTVFSNTRALIELGWSGVLVEASPKCYNTIKEFYKNDKNIEVVNVAIGKEEGWIDFYESEGAVATAYEPHYQRWKTIQKDYEKIKIVGTNWRKFYKTYGGIYNFVSIDTEGWDADILEQIPLNEIGVELLCVEYTYEPERINDYLISQGFTNLLYQSGENILVCR